MPLLIATLLVRQSVPNDVDERRAERVESANKSPSQPTTIWTQLAVPAVPDAPAPTAGDTSARASTPRPSCSPPGARRKSDCVRGGSSGGRIPAYVLLTQPNSGVSCESRTLSGNRRDASPRPSADVLKVMHPSDLPPAAIYRERTWQRGATALSASIRQSHHHLRVPTSITTARSVVRV